MQFPTLPEDDDLQKEISFDAVDIDLPVIDEASLVTWLSAVAKTYGRTVVSLGYVFCSDAYLLEMNVERLEHDTYTDIITFELGDPQSSTVEGECYISLDRVRENAASFGESYTRELHRVIVHGLLHLCGLSDKTEVEAGLMRKAEESSLALLS